MSSTVLINISGDDFKSFLKNAIKEVLGMTEIKTEEEPITIEEAANFLDIELNTLYEKTSKKLVPYYKKGKKLYFYKSELQAYIKNGRIKTAREIEAEAITHSITKK